MFWYSEFWRALIVWVCMLVVFIFIPVSVKGNIVNLILILNSKTRGAKKFIIKLLKRSKVSAFTDIFLKDLKTFLYSYAKHYRAWNFPSHFLAKSICRFFSKKGRQGVDFLILNMNLIHAQFPFLLKKNVLISLLIDLTTYELSICLQRTEGK